MSELEPQREEFEQKKKELSALRSKLNFLHNDKEAAYKELKVLRDQIRTKSSRIKVLREERDNLTKKVKEQKQERDLLNKEAQEKANEKKEVLQKKTDLSEKIERGENPRMLKETIRRMESRLETEVMPFEKEKEMRKVIKSLQAKYKKVQHLEEVWKEVNSATADFSETRRKAQDLHESIQGIAQQSQAKHEELNAIYESIKKLREEEQKLAEKHLQFKVQWETAKKEADALFARVGELAKLFNEEMEKSFKVKVREKTDEVREKIKNRKKLSTEDILAFQALDE